MDGSRTFQHDSARTVAALPQGKFMALEWARVALGAHPPATRQPDSLCVTRPQWDAQRHGSLRRVRQALQVLRYAVRSDAFDEDQFAGSQAGRYLSLLDVEPPQLEAAIDAVFARMPGHPGDQVLVQSMLAPARRACVASTHRIADGAPWYCVEFGHGDSAVVTAGRATGRQWAWPRTAFSTAPPLPADALAAAVVSSDLEGLRIEDVDARAVLKLLRAIEACGLREPFEIECLFTDSGLPWLLQLRRLAMQLHWPRPAPRPASSPDPTVFEPEPGLLGERTALSLMSDWNPAELIGSHPRPLALSLFQHLISRGSWWRSRAALGYRAPPRAGLDLLRPVLGRPYVDLRRSLNSLLPADLADPIGARLIEAWVERLHLQRELHDKIEFEICRSVRDFRAPAAVHSELGEVLSARSVDAFEGALCALSCRLLATKPWAMPPPVKRVPSSAGGPLQPLMITLRHARACAYVFAANARLAFAAEAQLRSAVQRGAITPERMAALRRSLGAATGLFDASTDAPLWRPSSFDITQPLLRVEACVAGAPIEPFVPTPAETRALAQLLGEAGFALGPAAWLRWLAAATRAREAGKYALMQPLALLLEQLATLGAAHQLDRASLSWVPLSTLLRGLCGQSAVARLHARAERAQQRAARERRWLLGPVLRDAHDFNAFDSLGLLPNFIGRRVCRAPLQVLAHGDPQQHIQPGAVIALRQADPGYDWLFERGIAGLITAWGGAHSHMAIRCAEFDLPAAIGCGETVWARLQQAREVHLDPLEQALWLY